MTSKARKLKAYKKVLSHVHRGTVNPTLMSDSVEYSYERVVAGQKLMCGVGCLFTAAQRKDLQERHINSDTIRSVSREIGVRNLTAVTGLTLDELEDLQEAHDGGTTSSFTMYLNSKIQQLSV